MIGKNWTVDEDNFLQDNYEIMSAKEIGIKLNRTLLSVKSRLLRLGITKSKKALKAIRSKPNSGQFRKGRVADHGLPIGSITKWRHTKGEFFLWIKLRDNDTVNSLENWKMLHLHVWEVSHGPVPAGHLITFKDGDRLNCELTNLEMISQQEIMKRNSASLNMTDKYVAMTITGFRRSNEVSTLLEFPELIDLKRQQLILNQALKEHGKVSTKTN